MVVDKCLRELAIHLVKTVSHGNPTTVDRLVQLIETAGATEALVRAGGAVRPTRRPNPKNKRKMGPPKNADQTRSPSQEPRTSAHPRQTQCYRCGAFGRIACHCTTGDEPMLTEGSTSTRREGPAPTPAPCWHAEVTPARWVSVRMGCIDTHAFFDSGSMVSLIREQWRKSVINFGGDYMTFSQEQFLRGTPK